MASPAGMMAAPGLMVTGASRTDVAMLVPEGKVQLVAQLNMLAALNA